jgi:hypothetical protein
MTYIYNDDRLDASENAFLNQELEHVRSKLYEELLGPQKGRLLVPVTGEVPTGAETDSYNVMQMFGTAKVGGGAYSTTPPRADISRRKVINSIVPVVNAYGYHVQELRNAAQGNFPLVMHKGRAAKEAMSRIIDGLLLIGSTVEGLAGLFTLSGALTVTRGTGVAGDTWDLKTSDEVVKDLFALEHQIVSNSLEALTPNTLVLPLTEKQSLSSRRMRDGSDTTILEFYTGNSEHITSVESSSRLESNTAWTGKRAMAYRNDPNMIEAVIPQEFEQMAPQDVNFETIINCHMRYGGIRTYQPESVAFMDNI